MATEPSHHLLVLLCPQTTGLAVVHLPRLASDAVFDAPQDMVGPSGCQGTLLTHIQLAINPIPRTLSTALLSSFLSPSLSLCLPFPTSHPYQTHISMYTKFPNFRLPEDDTGIDASSDQPFHPNISPKAFDVVVPRKTRVTTALCNPYRHKDFQKKARTHAYFQLPKFAEEKGRGSMNPLILHNYYVKAVGRLTGELGEDVELLQTFLPSVSQVRPLEGCTACLLQGQHPHESILQEQYSSSVQMPLPLFRVPIVIGTCYSACQPAWRPEDQPREAALPEWIPSCDVPQHQTALLELQHAFSKTAAQKCFHDSIGETNDLLRERDTNCMVSMFFISLTDTFLGPLKTE
ncbi:LOW QUALITY PROTEIN: sperm-associated microtubule inner protein 4 [Cariama cristata]